MGRIPINAKAFWDLLGRRKTHHQQRKRLTEILFADDMELVAKSASDLQAMLSIFDRIARTFGQLISAKKSKVMVIKRGQGQERATIMVGEDQLEVVEEFRYLGSFEHKTGSMGCEMSSRKNKMNAAYHGFKHVLLDKRLALRTRLELYNAIVVPNALYGCQVWNVTAVEVIRISSKPSS